MHEYFREICKLYGVLEEDIQKATIQYSGIGYVQTELHPNVWLMIKDKNYRYFTTGTYDCNFTVEAVPILYNIKELGLEYKGMLTFNERSYIFYNKELDLHVYLEILFDVV